MVKGGALVGMSGGKMIEMCKVALAMSPGNGQGLREVWLARDDPRR